MVSLLFGPDEIFIAFLAASNDMISDVEYLDLDPLDLLSLQLARLPKFQDRLESGLRMDLGVVFFHNRARDPLQVFL